MGELEEKGRGERSRVDARAGDKLPGTRTVQAVAVGDAMASKRTWRLPASRLTERLTGVAGGRRVAKKKIGT